MFRQAYIDTKPVRWYRTVNVRTQRHIDERGLTVDVRPSSKNNIVLSNDEKLEDFTIQMQIFNADPKVIFASVECPLLGKLEALEFPISAVGMLQYVEHECLAGWCSVGPKNFEELWKEATRPERDTTLKIAIGPLDDKWELDLNSIPILFVLDASFRIVTH